MGAVAAHRSWGGEEGTLPNIVVILTDDQGYADISLNPHHPREVSTPHMDSLAREGVVFTQGYISGPVCSPTRAGLMLGRYQQRVGVYTAGDGGRGFDPGVPIFPSFLPDEYVSTAIGKWHLGLDDDYPELKWHALNRGFDECYKFMGRGAHDYFELKGASGTHDSGPIYRGKERIDDEGYLTDRLSEEAVAFIDRHRAKGPGRRPFFLYLAYNAVHFPKQAPPGTLERHRQRSPDIGADRQVLMAMLEHLDRGIGTVIAKLKADGVFENTLLFFLTDNGGAKVMSACNAPLRGFKHSLYEGGIRTPFIVSWPARFTGGRTVDTPVISLDILPTALAAAGVQPAARHSFDGRSLLPLLAGRTYQHHDALYWSTGPEGGGAVRRGDWKLHTLRGRQELFNLAVDPSETTDLAAEYPGKVAELQALYDAWLEPMPPAIVSGRKQWRPPTAEELARKKRRGRQKEAREAEKAARRAERRPARRKE